MNCEIICVGTELLLGDIVNTNAQFLSKELANIGINVFHQSVVGDNAARLKRLIMQVRLQSNIIIFTGGLGPTPDDLTKETVCEAFGVPLVEHTESLEKIKEYFKHSGKAMPESNNKQAYLPKGCTVFPNDIGTAPGCAFESSGCIVILLPGPPREMTTMFNNYALPYLAKLSDKVLVSHNIKISGLGESFVAEKLSNFINQSNPTVSPYCKVGDLTLRVTASATNASMGESMCSKVIDDIKEELGDNVYGIDKEGLQDAVVELLKEKNLKLATAESCTAGLLSARITDIPGASEVFDIGISAYSNQIKINALGVKSQTIIKYGAVSAETAAEMAVGIHSVSGSSIGLSVTGVAGPDTSEGKPVGLVYFGLTDGEKIWTEKLMVSGAGKDRDKVRTMAVITALDFVRRFIITPKDKFEGGVLIGQKPIVIDANERALSAIKGKKPFVAPKATATNSSAFSDKELMAMMQKTFNTVSDDNEHPELLNYDEGDKVPFIAANVDSDPDNRQISLLGHESADKGTFDFSPDANDNKKIIKNKIVSFLKYFLPWKGDKIGEIIRKSIFLVAIITLIVSSIYLIIYFAAGAKQDGIIDDARSTYSAVKDNDTLNDDGTYSKFNELLAANSDFRGWLTINGTRVDNPVYQTTDNDFYIDHNMDKEKSTYGALFIDYRAALTNTETSQNLVIYGHHMKNGSMFGSLKKYRDLSFYKENPTLTFDTLYKTGEYKVFAVFIINTLPEQDNGNLFNYRPTSFGTQEAFLSWIAEVRSRSLIDTPVDVIENDQILTLSTCIYDFDDARLVVMARRVRDGETSAVNVSKATLNADALYPAIWYIQKGLPVPEISSTTTSTYVSSQSSTVTQAYANTSSLTSSAVTSSSASSSKTTTSATSSKKSTPASSSPEPASTSGSNSTPSSETSTSPENSSEQSSSSSQSTDSSAPND